MEARLLSFGEKGKPKAPWGRRRTAGRTTTRDKLSLNG